MQFIFNKISLVLVDTFTNPEFTVVMIVVALLIALAVLGVIFYNRIVPREINADEYYKQMYLKAVEVKEVDGETKEEETEETEEVEEVKDEEALQTDKVEEVISEVPAASLILNIVEEEKEVVRRRTLTLEHRLRMGDDDLKRRYSEIKNHLLSYQDVKSRFTKRFDTFRFKNNVLAKIKVLGRNLKLYLAIDHPTELPSKYHVKDASNVKVYEDTPAYLRVRSDRATKYAKDLITMVMQDHNIDQMDNAETIDYAKLFPPISDEELEQAQNVTVKAIPNTNITEFESNDDLVNYLKSLSEDEIESISVVVDESVNGSKDVLEEIDNLLIVNKSKITIRVNKDESNEKTFVLDEKILETLKTQIPEKELEVTVTK